MFSSDHLIICILKYIILRPYLGVIIEHLLTLKVPPPLLPGRPQTIPNPKYFSSKVVTLVEYTSGILKNHAHRFIVGLDSLGNKLLNFEINRINKHKIEINVFSDFVLFLINIKFSSKKDKVRNSEIEIIK